MYQRMMIVGNLGKDVEVRYTQGGTPVGNMSVAVSERVKDGDEWKDHTEWFRVVMFGKTAENAGQYLAKGKRVLVEGRIRQRTYQDKDGNTRYSTELLADNVRYLSQKSEGDGDGGGNRQQQRSGGSNGKAGGRGSAPPPVVDELVIDDDLPF